MIEAVSLFMPMFNEEGNCEGSVRKAIEVLEKLGREFEVIVVDDGSSDRTGEIASRLAAEDSRVRLVQHEVNLGYGAAVVSGFAAARLPLIFFTDGDLQFDLTELPLVVDAMEGADAVSGYRIVRKDPWIRRLNAALFNRLARFLFSIPIRDVNCAFKMYRKSILEGVPLKSTGALINVEMMARLRKKGAVIREVGVHHFAREVGSQTGGNPAVIYRAFADLFRLWRELS